MKLIRFTINTSDGKSHAFQCNPEHDPKKEGRTPESWWNLWDGNPEFISVSLSQNGHKKGEIKFLRDKVISIEYPECLPTPKIAAHNIRKVKDMLDENKIIYLPDLNKEK